MQYLLPRPAEYLDTFGSQCWGSRERCHPAVLIVDTNIDRLNPGYLYYDHYRMKPGKVPEVLYE